MKAFLRRMLVLVALFVASTCLLYVRGQTFSYEDTREGSAMEAASLPVLYAKRDETYVGPFYGHTDDFDAAHVQNTLLVLDDSLSFPIYVFGRTSQPASIRYELRSETGERLIERGEVMPVGENEKGETGFQIKLQDLLSDGTRYILRLQLTDEEREVSYYTRVCKGGRLPIDKMLDYVTGFHEATFDSEKILDYTAVLEPDDSFDKKKLSHVTINASSSQLAWDRLSPRRITEPMLQVQAVDESFGSFLLRYLIEADAPDGEKAVLYVEEFFCVQWTGDVMYLLKYDRTAQQFFNPSLATLAGKGISLGIAPEDSLQVLRDTSGRYLVFVSAGELWCYDGSTERFSRIFSYANNDVSSPYALCREYELRPVSVHEDGSIEFVVAGYAVAGRRQGEGGISLMCYEPESEVLTEKLYLSSDRPYELLSEELDTLFYTNEEGLLHFLFHDAVYAMDPNGREASVIVSDIFEEGLVVNSSGTALARHDTVSEGVASSARVMYLDSGESYVIAAPSGEYVRVLGFIKNDLVVGYGRIADLTLREKLSSDTPLYRFEILSKEGECLLNYRYDGIYILGITGDDEKMEIRRATIEAGRLQYLPDDIMLSNEPEQTGEESGVATILHETWGRLCYVPTSKTPGLRSNRRPVKEILYTQDMALRGDATENNEEKGRFYGYYGGSLQVVTRDAGSCIMAVTDQFGYVTDDAGKIIWIRCARSGEASIPVAGASAGGQGDNSLDACLRVMLNKLGAVPEDGDFAAMTPEALLRERAGVTVLSLTGCELRPLLYYLDRGIPILWTDANGSARLITGYDWANVIVFDPAGAGTYRISQSDFAAQLSLAGCRLLGYAI